MVVIQIISSVIRTMSDINFWTLGFVIVLAVFLIYINMMCAEHFKSKRDKAEFVQKEAFPLFYGGDVSYKQYKNLIPNADAVEYTDVKNAYKTNKFTVSDLEKIV